MRYYCTTKDAIPIVTKSENRTHKTQNSKGVHNSTSFADFAAKYKRSKPLNGTYGGSTNHQFKVTPYRQTKQASENLILLEIIWNADQGEVFISK